MGTERRGKAPLTVGLTFSFAGRPSWTTPWGAVTEIGRKAAAATGRAIRRARARALSRRRSVRGLMRQTRRLVQQSQSARRGAAAPRELRRILARLERATCALSLKVKTGAECFRVEPLLATNALPELAALRAALECSPDARQTS